MTTASTVGHVNSVRSWVTVALTLWRNEGGLMLVWWLYGGLPQWIARVILHGRTWLPLMTPHMRMLRVPTGCVAWVLA